MPVAFHTKVIQMDAYPVINTGVVIADSKLPGLHPRLFSALRVPILLLKSSEANKTIQTVNRIHRFLIEASATRKTTLHAIGGGVICDLAAYAAATFKRGIPLILYPSTTMAMVDAAWGGKCAFNLGGYRNMIGTFYPASEVFLYPGFLNTLSIKERRQGWAEMIKLFHILPEIPEVNFTHNLLPKAETLWQYATNKLKICAADIYDKGQRRLLNLGHSFGHALESACNYRIGHGDAVICGMNMAAQLSHRLGLIDNHTHTAIYSDLMRYPLPKRFVAPLAPEQIEKFDSALLQDKKRNQEMQLILFTGWRKVAVHTTQPQIIKEFISKLT